MSYRKTNARRRAARRYIKNHSMYMAEWLVEIYDGNVYTSDDFDHIFWDPTSLSYVKYLALQKSTDNAKDRAHLKIWYYADYNLKNTPRKLMTCAIFFIIRCKLTRLPIDTIVPKEYDYIFNKPAPEPKIELHVDKHTIIGKEDGINA